MTIEELIAVFVETHPNNNPSCDGTNCSCLNSKVRIIPLDDSYNVTLCECCYIHELNYSRDLELEGKERILPELPFSVYPVYHGDVK